jgi:FtsP/CotA-like multicopper oxidase with cupredoxin domain
MEIPVTKEQSVRAAIRSVAILSGVLFGLLGAACSAPVATTAAAAGATRTYYIAADEVTWDYAPQNRNVAMGKAFGADEAPWVVRGPHKIGKEFTKALYREYTDETFTTLKPRPKQWEHLGYLGPLVRAEVGDTIKIVFKNNLTFPASLHPHGVFYEKASEGAPYGDGVEPAKKSAAPRGGTQTYTWPVPERSGPTEHEMSSVLWMYHSHVSEVADANAGLMGPMIITGKGKSKSDGSPTDVDREFVVAFAEFGESESPYIQQNIDKYAGDPKGISIIMDPFQTPMLMTKDKGDLGDFALRESLNGYIFGNLPGLTMKEGERVRWYLMATSNFELHSPHWHGNTVTINHMRTDVAALQTMGMIIADMVPDNAGTWMFHCHVSGHLKGGMQALYTVEPKAAPRATN